MDRPEVTCLLVLVAVALAITHTDARKENITIAGTTVTLECPKNGTWSKNKVQSKRYTIEKYDDQHNGLYKCTADETSFYFYTKLKVCEDCVELDEIMVMGILLGDVLITLGVILLVYFWAKKKAINAPPQRAQRLQPTPGMAQSPDVTYQELNPGTRNADVYSDVRKR